MSRVAFLAVGFVLVGCMGRVPALPAAEEWRGERHVEGVQTIPQGREVRLVAGARLVMAPGSQLRVEGTLVAEGTNEAPVSVSGEGWKGVVVAPGGVAHLRHLDIRGGDTCLAAANSRLDVRHSRIHGCTVDGLAAAGAILTLWSNEFQGNGRHGALLDVADSGVIRPNRGEIRRNVFSENRGSGLVVRGGVPHLKGNRFERNGEWGLNAATDDAMPTIEENQFAGNHSSARIPFSAFPESRNGNGFGPNKVPFVHIFGNRRSAPLRFEVFHRGEGREVRTFVFEGVSEASQAAPVTVGPAVDLRFAAGAALRTMALLDVDGTPTAPAVFASLEDVLWEQPSLPFGAPWLGLECFGGVRMRHAEIRYAGAGGLGALSVVQGAGSLRDVRILGSASAGIRVHNAPFVALNVEVVGSAGAAVQVSGLGGADVDVAWSPLWANGGGTFDLRGASTLRTRDWRTFSNGNFPENIEASREPHISLRVNATQIVPTVGLADTPDQRLFLEASRLETQVGWAKIGGLEPNADYDLAAVFSRDQGGVESQMTPEVALESGEILFPARLTASVDRQVFLTGLAPAMFSSGRLALRWRRGGGSWILRELHLVKRDRSRNLVGPGAVRLSEATGRVRDANAAGIRALEVERGTGGEVERQTLPPLFTSGEFALESLLPYQRFRVIDWLGNVGPWIVLGSDQWTR